jgi:flagella basal body P-ring formation protein FlgA
VSEMPVPKVTIYPGDVLTDGLLVMKKFSRRRDMTPAYDTREAVVGKIARRTLVPGRPIPVNSLKEPEIVKQGHRARIIFQADGLVITGEALALQSGNIGDIISLRNTDSNTTIRGTVLADGTVSVGRQ